MTRFKVAWLSAIAGRGTAIAGDVLDGTVRVGDRIVAPANMPGLPLAISGVEFADNVSTRESWVALLVAAPPTGLQDALSAGTVLEIAPSPPGARPDLDPPHNVR